MKSARCMVLIVPLLILSSLITCQVGFGQAITGDILGTVQDSSGGVVAGAKITLTAVDTGIKLEAISDAGGNYLFAQLKPGHYSVEVSKQGFQTSTTSDIELQVGQRTLVDVALQVGTVSQTIEVSAGGVVLLDTQTSTVGQVVDNKDITQLPLNGRNFINLMLTTAGVAPLLNGVAEASFWTGQSMVSNSVAGLRESNESFLVDGIESRSARFGGVGLRPSIDAIQEFNMQTSDFSAEFGRSSVVINTTLKSGANKIHGTGFEFIQGSQLDANDFFNNLSGTPIPSFKLNNFGGSFGGPVNIPRLYKGTDKTFFFLNYEGIRSRQGASNRGLVPSLAQLQGNLADDSGGTGIFPKGSSFCTSNPGSGKCVNVIDPTTGLPFTNNVIPSGRIDPFVQKWGPFWVAPNVTEAPGQTSVPIYNVINSPDIRNDMNQFNTRLDHAISPKDNIFGSFSFEDRPHNVPGLMPTQGTYYPLRNELLSVTETYTFSPTVVNELRFGYNRGKTYLLSLGADHTNYASTVFGLKNTSQNPFDAGVPDAGITGFSGPGSFSESIGSLDQDFQIVDSLSIVKGKHNIKLGENYIHEKFYEITDFAGVPSFNFQGQFTGVGLGDFLLGEPYSGTTSVGDSHQNLRSNYYAGFIQDDWRVLPRLTFNIGGRYEKMQNPYDTEDRTEWFDPTAINPVDGTPGAVVSSRSGGVRNGIVDPEWHEFAPRFGFAYSPGFMKNTVVRSSYGIFWASDVWNDLQFLVVGPNFYSSQTVTTTSNTESSIHLSDMFPQGGLGGTSNNPFSIDKRYRDPYVQEWTFDIQHNFAKDWLVDVAYVGNVGQKLRLRQDQNYRKTYDPTGTIPYQDAVPYPDYSWILTDMSKGWSSYNGLLTKLEKRFSNGVSLRANYTWSHSLDLGEGDEGPYSGIRTELKGNMTYDVRQRFVLDYGYELPFGKGKRFASGASGAVDKVIGGWRVTGITTFQTGQWVPVGLPSNWANDGSWGTNRPMKIGNAIPANRSYLNYWNVNAFEYPGCSPSYNADPLSCPTPDHIVGDSGRNTFEVPGLNNWDFSLMKDTRIDERITTQFRAEFFNGWNHEQFGPPDSSLVPGQFGVIGSSLEGPRTIQFGLKFIF